jgi:CRP-like cAMP-binding protein
MDLSAFNRFARTFQAGEMIFSEFEPGDAFYMIQSGRVELVKIIGDVERTLDILRPPEMFGEMAILENSPRSASAIALEDPEARVADVFLMLNETQPNPEPDAGEREFKLTVERMWPTGRG